MADSSLLAHLFRRAGFGARTAELRYYASNGYRAAVEDLLAGRPVAGEGAADAPSIGANPTIFDIQAWWAARLLSTTTPLVERMTLFFHNLIATGYVGAGGPEPVDLLAQNNLFRGHALGNWADLCHALVNDLALAVYLSADQSSVGHVNENLARELMERFMVGPGNYSEADVREIARALTGYTVVTSQDLLGNTTRKLVFVPGRHDQGSKTFLGHTGNFGPADVVNVILARPAASTYLATRLVQAFVHPSAPAGLVSRVAGALTSSGWDLKSALRTIFVAPEFQDPAVRGAIVKTPSEFISGMMRAFAYSDPVQAHNWMQRCGQTLFMPPNVGGWPPNEAWLATDLMLARYNAAADLSFLVLHHRKGSVPVPNLSIDNWAQALGMTELAPATRSALDQYLATSPPASRIDGLVTLLLASPDFSLA